MITTVTFNPSLDYVVSVDKFRTGTLNRTKTEKIFPGGKGINVSIMLAELGMETVACGFTAGFTGTMLLRLLDDRGVRNDFITVAQGFTRINVKIRSDTASELNGQGPVIGAADIRRLYEKLDGLTSDDVLILAGTIPDAMPQTVYMEIMKRLNGKKMKVVVDTTGNLLKNVLACHPFLVKPNGDELGDLFHVRISGIPDVVTYGRELQRMGAVNVLVSLGKDGAVLIDESGNVLQEAAPAGKVCSAVGAGDSMVAGFLTGYLKSGEYQTALKLGICTGSATAFCEGLAGRKDIEALLPSLGRLLGTDAGQAFPGL